MSSSAPRMAMNPLHHLALTVLEDHSEYPQPFQVPPSECSDVRRHPVTKTRVGHLDLRRVDAHGVVHPFALDLTTRLAGDLVLDQMPARIAEEDLAGLGMG